MLDEIERSRKLKAVSSDPLYFLEYVLDDIKGIEYAATLGGLLSERDLRARIARVSVRVGSPEFDNTNFVYSDANFSSRFDPDQFPLDDDYAALRRGFWLATDRNLKGAIEAIGRKRAALRNVTQSETLPDFSAAPPQKLDGDLTWQTVDEKKWKAQTVSLSTIFQSFPGIQDSSVEFHSMQSRTHFANSEGTAATFLDPVAYLLVRAAGQAPDGMRLRNSLLIPASDAKLLPPEGDLKRQVTRLAEDLQAMTSAPLGEAYSGPVLFEGTAGAQLMAEILGSALAATRRPVGQPGQQVPFQPGPFEGRMGSRVMPDSFTVLDDPTKADWKGAPLLGHYRLDSEGVAPEPLTVIEKGVLKTLLSTRQPTKSVKTSNGRARIPGLYGAKAAGISNLFVQTSEAVPAAELRTRLLKMLADREKPYALVVRQMDFPSSAAIGELRRIAANSERPVSLPLLTYRLYPDGREQLVRGVRFRSLSARSLRDIVAGGDDDRAFHYLGSLAPFAVIGGSNYVYSASVVAPSLLFDDLEMEPLDQDLPQLPVAAPPPLTN